jgi:hypothetical protein
MPQAGQVSMSDINLQLSNHDALNFATTGVGGPASIGQPTAARAAFVESGTAAGLASLPQRGQSDLGFLLTLGAFAIAEASAVLWLIGYW